MGRKSRRRSRLPAKKDSPVFPARKDSPVFPARKDNPGSPVKEDRDTGSPSVPWVPERDPRERVPRAVRIAIRLAAAAAAERLIRVLGAARKK